MAPGDNSTITGDQLPFNNTRAKSTRQLCVNREEAFNHKNNNHILEQTQLNNETSTSEDSILEDPQLPIPRTNIVLGPLNKENKKNVQFQTLINDQSQGNSVNCFYDPILITPRHPYSNSPSGVLSHEPIKDPLPDPPLNPKGKYFSGTVENGKGSDFFGYYYMSNSGSEMPVRGKTHHTSNSTTQNLFPNQNTRYQEVYPTPLQGREKDGNSENPGNPGGGPCFNCKECGHYSRDCPEVHGVYDTPIKRHYYSPQQEHIPPRPLKTETYLRHHHPPS